MNVCLTFVLPRNLEEIFVEHLLAHPQWAPGFTTFAAEGHGAGLRLESAEEAVRGRARRVAVQIVTGEEAALALLAHLRASLPNPDIAYWVVPVREFGRLA